MMLDDGGSRILGPYKLGRKLGEGNFAKVHLAQDHLGQKVAIKVFNKQAITSMKHYTLKHVEREINALRVCAPHPHVANLLEVLETETDVFFVMEYVPGGELFDYIVSEGRLAEEESARLFYQIVSCVEYCHSRGIAHRDLKPENILLDTNMNVRIVDFGLASHQGQYQRSTAGFAGGMPAHKKVADKPNMQPPKMSTQCGSPEYAAPEVIRNDHGYEGAPVDVWSLGVVLYAMICGTLPFTAASIPQIVSNTLRGQFDIPSHVSSAAQKLLRAMLCTNHQKRITLCEVMEHPWFEIRPEPHQRIEARPLTMVRAFPDSYVGSASDEENVELHRIVAVSVTEPSQLADSVISIGDSSLQESRIESPIDGWMLKNTLPWETTGSGRKRPARNTITEKTTTTTTTTTTDINAKITEMKISTPKSPATKLIALTSAPQLSAEEMKLRRENKRKLFKAAEEGDVDTLKKLFLNKDVDLCWTGIDNWTVLHFAARKGHAEAVEVLLTSLKPVDINAITKAGWTPLMMAADRGHTDVISCLLKFSANIHLVTFAGKTAIFLARESGHNLIAKQLTEASSQRTLENEKSTCGKMLQREFSRAAEEGDLNLMMYLLNLSKKKQAKAKKKAQKSGTEYKVDPRDVVDFNATGMDNWTALHFACRKGRLRVVQALVRSLKVDNINALTTAGWTPLMFAAHKGHIGVCKLLLRYDANITLKNLEKNTASTLATKAGHIEIAQLLLNKRGTVTG